MVGNLELLVMLKLSVSSQKNFKDLLQAVLKWALISFIVNDHQSFCLFQLWIFGILWVNAQKQPVSVSLCLTTSVTTGHTCLFLFSSVSYYFKILKFDTTIHHSFDHENCSSYRIWCFTIWPTDDPTIWLFYV